MKVSALGNTGVLLIEPRVFGDARGYFMESWENRRYTAAGVPGAFCQDNVSHSRRGTLRGLHLQHPGGQGKLVQILVGEVYDVSVDVRVGSPTFGQWVAATLSEDNHHQLFIPPGFAHGFVVRSEFALFTYKCTTPYDPMSELGIAWDDPDLGIDWGVETASLSDKDRTHPRLRDIDPARLPAFEIPPADGGGER